MAMLSEPGTAEAVGVSVGDGVTWVGVSLGVIAVTVLVAVTDSAVIVVVGLADTITGVPVWIEGVRDGTGAEGL